MLLFKEFGILHQNKAIKLILFLILDSIPILTLVFPIFAAVDNSSDVGTMEIQIKTPNGTLLFLNGTRNS